MTRKIDFLSDFMKRDLVIQNLGLDVGIDFFDMPAGLERLRGKIASQQSYKGENTLINGYFLPEKESR